MVFRAAALRFSSAKAAAKAKAAFKGWAAAALGAGAAAKATRSAAGAATADAAAALTKLQKQHGKALGAAAAERDKYKARASALQVKGLILAGSLYFRRGCALFFDRGPVIFVYVNYVQGTRPFCTTHTFHLTTTTSPRRRR